MSVSLWSNGHHATWYTEVGLGPGDIVLDGEPVRPPPQKKTTRQPRNFRPMHCGQTAKWIKMPLRTEIGLGPVDIVLDGDPALPKREHSTSTFRPTCIVAKRLNGSRCHLVRTAEVDLSPGHIVLDGDPTLPEGAREPPPPLFRPMSIVAKRSSISATAEDLSVMFCFSYVLQVSNKKASIR